MKRFAYADTKFANWLKKYLKEINLKELDDITNKPRLADLCLDHRHGVAEVGGDAVDDSGVWSADNDWGFRSRRLKLRETR